MGFIENILENFKDTSLCVKPSFKAVLFDEKAVFMEGVKGIKSFNTEEISLFVGKGEVLVKGNNLFIKKYCLGDVAICGQIKSIEKV